MPETRRCRPRNRRPPQGFRSPAGRTPRPRRPGRSLPCTRWARARHRPGPAHSPCATRTKPASSGCATPARRHGADRGDGHRRAVQFRPRRQLVVTVDDGSDTCVLRFFSFYPSQQKALALGTRLRIRGELKGGFLGWQMVHPTYKAAGGELPHALTPVYSTVAACPRPTCARRWPAACREPTCPRPFPPMRLRLRARQPPGACARPCTSCTTRRPRRRWPRWRIAATPPGCA